MGKNGGGALSMWIKEFTSLVFTQTIQAFIYTMIISMILFGMGTRKEENANDNNSALGFMATVALLSVFKVEEMSKRIFGLHDTKANPGNAMKSIAKTAFAAKLGKRALDNIGKITGGIGAITKARQDRKKLATRLEEDKKDFGGMSGGTSGPANAGDITGAGGGVSTYGGGGGTSAHGESANISLANKRRMRDAYRQYQDKLSEINKQRNEGIKNIFSGVTESAGAIFGGATGMVLGGADGNLDEAIQGIMAGAGVGDSIGQSAVNSVEKAINFATRNYKREKGMGNKELKRIFKDFENEINNKQTYNAPDIGGTWDD